MTRHGVLKAAAFVALPLALTGCSGNAEAPAGAAQVEELRSEQQLPDTFPTGFSEVSVETSGEQFGIWWRGEPIGGACAPSSASPNSAASTFLIQDAALSDVQKCGNVWQAKQVDGSYVAWN